MSFDISQLETICMEMIGTTGEGRAKVHEALVLCLEEKYVEAKDVLNEAEKLLNQAHNIQFLKLMKPQAEGENIPFNILLIHAMDLLMISTSEKDIVQKIVNNKIERK